MPTITLTFADPDLPTAVELTSLTRLDTNAAVELPAAPAFAEGASGVWSLDLSDLVPGLEYFYVATVTWSDASTSPVFDTVDGDTADLEGEDEDHRPQPWAVVTPPAGRPVTWSQAKAHLRLTGDTEQTYVETLIDAAADYAQEAMQCSLMPQTILATFFDAQPVVLPRGPIIRIESVAGADAASVDSSAYLVAHYGHRAEVKLRLSVAYPISVRYVAGYANADAVPAALRLAILQHVATLYENRESVSDKAKLPVPHSLADFYRRRARGTGVG